MKYISLCLKNRNGGYLIPDTEYGRKSVERMLKEDPTLIDEGNTDVDFSIHVDYTRDDIFVKYRKARYESSNN